MRLYPPLGPYQFGDQPRIHGLRLPQPAAAHSNSALTIPNRSTNRADTQPLPLASQPYSLVMPGVPAAFF